MSVAELAVMVKARCPLIWIKTYEEQRVMSGIRDLGRQLQMNVALWSCIQGYQHFDKSSLKGGDIKTPPGAINYAVRESGPDVRGLFVLADFHHYMKDANIVRSLREAAQTLKLSKKSIIFIGPIVNIPAELEKDILIIDWTLPDRAEIQTMMNGLEAPSGLQPIDPSVIPGVIDACLGLTRQEIDQAITRSFVISQGLDVRVILRLKKEIIRKSGILEYFEADISMEDIGGMPALKEWMRKRKRAFGAEARAFGLNTPKGAMLIGIPGCGKSLCAKAVGAAWQLPLLRLDVGKIFGGLVGASEENMRRAIATAEAVQPCVLWLDELEKGFSGVSGSGQSDGGTTARVFASFLTWMQEKTSQVFVIATANDVRALPPELMRKGRFDEIFFVDLPDKMQREEIFRIHLGKKNQIAVLNDSAQLELLLEDTGDFSGAEIEQVIMSALYDAFDADRTLSIDDLIHSAKEVTPLKVTMSEQITMLRDWARSRARAA